VAGYVAVFQARNGASGASTALLADGPRTIGQMENMELSQKK
jgi:hypothetical protein